MTHQSRLAKPRTRYLEQGTNAALPEQRNITGVSAKP